ncbi:MAG: hypothetical protein QW569_00705 [Candidatus Bathyarchaeia archaeon]
MTEGVGRRRLLGFSIAIILLLGIAVFEAFYAYNLSSLIESQDASIRSLEEEYSNLSEEKVSLEDKLTGLSSELESEREQVDQLLLERDRLKADMENLTVPAKRERVKPTYDEFRKWLKRDKTDQLTYKKFRFDCDDFASTLIEKGEENGWDMAYVYIWDGKGSGHALCAIELKDKGTVWVEPQEDKVFPPKKVGEAYLTGYLKGRIEYILIIW